MLWFLLFIAVCSSLFFPGSGLVKPLFLPFCYRTIFSLISSSSLNKSSWQAPFITLPLAHKRVMCRTALYHVHFLFKIWLPTAPDSELTISLNITLSLREWSAAGINHASSVRANSWRLNGPHHLFGRKGPYRIYNTSVECLERTVYLK